MEIKVKTKDDAGNTVGPYTFTYDMPENLDALKAKFGEEAVTEGAISSFTIGFQNNARRLMVESKDKTGKVIREALTQEQIQAELQNWMPDTRAIVRLTPLERATKSLDSMSDADRKSLLDELQARLKQKKVA